MKKLFTLFLSLLLLLSLFSCDKKEPPINVTLPEKEPVRICALQGPTGMGLSQMIAENKFYDVSIISSSEISSIVSKIMQNECDICAVPINFASVLFNKTGGKIKIIGSATKGVLQMLSNSDDIHSVQDLKGKTIYATGQGSTPEYILDFVLEKNGLDPEKDVKIEFVSDHNELSSLLSSNIYGVGMLPEPNVSVVQKKNPSFKSVLDMTEEWNKISENELIQGVYIARSEFIENNPKKISEFLDALKTSVDFTNTYISAAAKYISDANIISNKEIAEIAIPKCNIVSGGKESYNDIYACLEVLFKANASSVGGKLPEKPELFY